MARSQDLLPSQQGWLQELARAEIHPDAEKLLQLGKSFDPQVLVEESAVNFLTELREQFLEHAQIFNAYSENGKRYTEIKVYSLAHAAADFMLFRNQVKLIFSHSSHGIIQISFAHHARSTLAVNGQNQTSSLSGGAAGGPGSIGSGPQELLVQMGPFRDVYWTFRGEKVSPEQVSKFYFMEFAKVTRDASRSKVGNQLLLNQIKALLQEKGLDL